MTTLALAFVALCVALALVGIVALAQEIVAAVATDWPEPGQPDYWERRWKQICDVEHSGTGPSGRGTGKARVQP